MREIVGDIPHTVHQVFDPRQHGVEDTAEAVEFVITSGHWHPPREVAAHNLIGSVSHSIETALHIVAHEYPAC